MLWLLSCSGCCGWRMSVVEAWRTTKHLLGRGDVALWPLLCHGLMRSSCGACVSDDVGWSLAEFDRQAPAQ